MNFNRLQRLSEGSTDSFKTKSSKELSEEYQKVARIEELRESPNAKTKHTLNGISNDILADFLELQMSEGLSQPKMLEKLIEHYKNK